MANKQANPEISHRAWSERREKRRQFVDRITVELASQASSALKSKVEKHRNQSPGNR